MQSRDLHDSCYDHADAEAQEEPEESFLATLDLTFQNRVMGIMMTVI